MDRVAFDRVRKSLPRLPHFILSKLRKWARDVELLGLDQLRKVPGFHDEPLKGSRKGQRSIRLSRGYRAIYMVHREPGVRVIVILEVSKHEY